MLSAARGSSRGYARPGTMKECFRDFLTRQTPGGSSQDRPIERPRMNPQQCEFRDTERLNWDSVAVLETRLTVTSYRQMKTRGR